MPRLIARPCPRFALLLLPLLWVAAHPPRAAAQAAPDTFRIDNGHTRVQFRVERFGMVQVVGRFDTVAGWVRYAGTPESVAVGVQIQAASLNTGLAIRDEHLRGPVWLDAQQHPVLEFVSTGVQARADGYVMTGTLRIRDVRKPVVLPFTCKGPLRDPTGATTISLRGRLVVSRMDFGLRMDKRLPSGELLIGDEVEIDIWCLAQLPH